MFEISAELLQKLANYLATRPWGDVEPLLHEIQSLKKIEDVKPEDKKDE